jgi:hypothetical protein
VSRLKWIALLSALGCLVGVYVTITVLFDVVHVIMIIIFNELLSIPLENKVFQWNSEELESFHFFVLLFGGFLGMKVGQFIELAIKFLEKRIRGLGVGVSIVLVSLFFIFITTNRGFFVFTAIVLLPVLIFVLGVIMYSIMHIIEWPRNQYKSVLKDFVS